MLESEHPALQLGWWLLYVVVVEGISIGVRYLAVNGGFGFPFFWIAIVRVLFVHAISFSRFSNFVQYSVIGFLIAAAYYVFETVRFV
jgi:hypothetical protein